MLADPRVWVLHACQIRGAWFRVEVGEDAVVERRHLQSTDLTALVGEVAKDNCHEGWAVHKGHLTQANAVYFCGAASETSCIVGCNADGDDVPEDRRMNSHDKKAEMCVENCGDNGLCSEACTQYFNYLAGCMTTQNEGEFANVAAAASERFKSKGTSLLRGDDDPVINTDDLSAGENMYNEGGQGDCETIGLELCSKWAARTDFKPIKKHREEGCGAAMMLGTKDPMEDWAKWKECRKNAKENHNNIKASACSHYFSAKMGCESVKSE